MKTKLVYKVEIEIKSLFIGLSYRDLLIIRKIYKIYDRKFLWFKQKPIYEISIINPRISNPFYNGEFNTNSVLDYFETILRDKLEDKILEFEEKGCLTPNLDNRIIIDNIEIKK